MVEVTTEQLASRLAAHLEHWLGSWPPSGPLEVVGSPLRSEPGWDGRLHRVAGVATPTGAVLSVPEDVAPLVSAVATGGLDALGPRLGDLVGMPGARLGRGVFRSSERLVDLPDAGVWRERDDPVVPEWLRPFNGGVLLALDEAGRYLAGVGCKRHDDIGVEIAVATEPAARGRGLAKRLVAQAARAIVADGGIATYLHRQDNAASAAVAEAAGFPDRGWQVLGLPTAS